MNYLLQGMRGIMTDLGTKRQCPKCDAKFYDFGAVDPIQCPKCKHKWKIEAAKPVKPKKEIKQPVKPKRKLADDELGGSDVDLPDIEDDDALELEPMEDDGVEMTSLEEVEEHEESEEVDPNSDDADDEMFAEMVGDEKLVDDLEDHLEDESDDEEDEDADEDDEDEDDDDSPKRRRR